MSHYISAETVYSEKIDTITISCFQEVEADLLYSIFAAINCSHSVSGVGETKTYTMQQIDEVTSKFFMIVEAMHTFFNFSVLEDIALFLDEIRHCDEEKVNIHFC